MKLNSMMTCIAVKAATHSLRSASEAAAIIDSVELSEYITLKQ